MSLYVSHPGVPRVRLEVYPKRRRGVDEQLDWAPAAVPGVLDPAAEVCYADFFVTAEDEMMRAS